MIGRKRGFMGRGGVSLGQAGVLPLVTSLIDGYSAYQAAEAAGDAADAAKAAAKAQTAAAQAAIELERLRIAAEQQSRADDIIPGVPNTVTFLGGLAVAGGVLYGVLG